MIYFVTTATHRYTHEAVARERRDFTRIAYPMLLARRSLPRGTYIFADFDRLGFWQLEVAAHVYRVLEAAGCRVLNDPARVLQRLALLRQLRREGINSFGAWAASDAAEVDRFPVFIRTASAHRGNLTGLIEDKAALDGALSELIGQGFPIADLAIIEYRAEPLHDGVFRKMAAYRIGDALVPAPSVHERSWTAKHGEHGAAGEADYAGDLALAKAMPHEAVLRRAFDAARIDYGRADFGMVGGRPEIYEINTNPMMGLGTGHASPARAEALALSRGAYLSALAGLDTPGGGERVRIPPPAALAGRSRRRRMFAGYLWLP